MSSEGADPPDKRKVRTAAELLTRCFQCTCPERETTVYPKWVCFLSDHYYREPQFVHFTLENHETYPISYHMKTREKIFQVNHPNGFLRPRERLVLKLTLTTSDDWPLALIEYSLKRLKVIVETIRVPTWIQPLNDKEAARMAKQIWKRSAVEWPLERLYTKINVHLASSVLSNKNPPPTTNVHTKIRV